jgi:hypothetical protein
VFEHIEVEDRVKPGVPVNILDRAGDDAAGWPDFPSLNPLTDQACQIRIGLQARPFADAGIIEVARVAADAGANLEHATRDVSPEQLPDISFPIGCRCEQR